MPLTLKITKIPNLNTVVIKQDGGRFFVTTPNSLIIDKDGFLQLIEGLLKLEFIKPGNLMEILNRTNPIPEEEEN